LAVYLCSFRVIRENRDKAVQTLTVPLRARCGSPSVLCL